jgi:hypothetical protein
MSEQDTKQLAVLMDRINSVSMMLADWDGYYDPETKTGSLEGLAALVKDAFLVLQGGEPVKPAEMMTEEKTQEEIVRIRLNGLQEQAWEIRDLLENLTDRLERLEEKERGRELQTDMEMSAEVGKANSEFYEKAMDELSDYFSNPANPRTDTVSLSERDRFIRNLREGDEVKWVGEMDIPEIARVVEIGKQDMLDEATDVVVRLDAKPVVRTRMSWLEPLSPDERDELRRRACEDEAKVRSQMAWETGMSMWQYTGEDIAREREWDCFKKRCRNDWYKKQRNDWYKKQRERNKSNQAMDRLARLDEELGL